MIEIKVKIHEAKPEQMEIDVQSDGVETATQAERQVLARIKTALNIALQSLMHTNRNGVSLERETPPGETKRLDG